MNTSNYLIEFLHKVDILISEIDKLNSKVRLYQRNSGIFGIPFSAQFSISSDIFVKLREFLHDKIEDGNYYDSEIVNLKRNFSREFSYIVMKIEQEIVRIDNLQEKEMNKIVYSMIYNAKIKNEIDLRNSFYEKNSIFDRFLGVEKYRKLSYVNHDLKAKLLEKEYTVVSKEKKNIFELVNMIENESVKNGELLCLQDEMIKAFMIDKNIIKRNNKFSWRQPDLVPYGIFAKRSYYKILNKNLAIENDELGKELKKDLIVLDEKEKNFSFENLVRLNNKLTKLIQCGLRTNV